jgi:DNA-binding IclR family transcriptional regulator
LTILERFTPEETTLTVKELSESLEMPKPTVSRLATTLERHGFLRRDGRGYQLGPKTFELGALFAKQTSIAEVGRAPLEALARETLQTVCVGVLSGTDVTHVMVVTPPRPLHHVTEVGLRSRAHATGLGKALLAALPEDELERRLHGAPLAQLTPNTFTDIDELRGELAKTRERGYALDNEETMLGLRCVAIAMNLPRLGLSSVSVSGPGADYSAENVEGFRGLLGRTAEALVAAFDDAAGYALPAYSVSS